jgi:hypothetical protein
MRYPVSNDPDVIHAHRLRAALGLTVALFLVAGLGTLIVTAPPPPTQLSVNCIETGAGIPMSDVPTGVAGCVTRAEAIKPANPGPAATATADDPPIQSF